MVLLQGSGARRGRGMGRRRAPARPGPGAGWARPRSCRHCRRSRRHCHRLHSVKHAPRNQGHWARAELDFHVEPLTLQPGASRALGPVLWGLHRQSTVAISRGPALLLGRAVQTLPSMLFFSWGPHASSSMFLPIHMSPPALFTGLDFAHQLW